MKAGLFLAVLISLASALNLKAAGTPMPLRVAPANPGVQIGLDRQPLAPVGGTAYRLVLQSSQDLTNWLSQGELALGSNGGPSLSLTNTLAHQFFKLAPEVQDTGTAPDGAELFGYSRILQAELQKVGFLTPEQFAAQQPPPGTYVEGVSFDPTTALYWDAFNRNPAVVNSNLPPGSTEPLLYDFRLNAAELALFKTNGFVVSERLGSYSFADVYYRILADDLPVFVSADSILHAWHFSYERLLEESEETQLSPALGQILDGMHGQLAQVPRALLTGPLGPSLKDADYFLAVGRSLLGGARAATLFGSDAAVTNALQAVQDLKMLDFPIFGTTRTIDFSQFQIRGHYERSLNLGRYFQAFMWTARVDFRVLELNGDPQSLRELGTALVLSNLLQASGQADKWQQLDALIRLFVGRTDAMTFAELEPLLVAGGLTALESVTSLDQLRQLQQAILQGQLGLQLIQGDVYVSPFGPEQLQLPRAFVFTGQRFNPDGWALNEVIFDRILWNEDIPGVTFFKKVVRRYPSALDVAYSVLGNQPVGWEIAQRMLDTGNRSGFRDGLPYAHNLTALRATFDQVSTKAWQDSIYTRWLAALRELSAPTTDGRFPEAMRTWSWAMRTLNTQLASYTELKHDTVLYAKQPYTASIVCSYPFGFVEPVPGFWQKMAELAQSTADALESLPATGIISVTPSGNPGTWTPPIQVDLAQRQAARVSFCRNFAAQVGALANLAAKEQLQIPMTDAETLFLKSLMNRQDHPYGGATFDGWYPSLFYKDYGQLVGGGEDSNGSNKFDPLVTDIQTAPPDLLDPVGGVLHEGTGNVDLLMIAVDNGPDRAVYAGPLMSYYEFILPGPDLQRMTDSEWQTRFPGSNWPASKTPPPRPEWTQGYLAPK